MVHLVDFEQDRVDYIVTFVGASVLTRWERGGSGEGEYRISSKLGWLIHRPTFDFVPVKKLSMQITSWPMSMSRSTRCEPTKPAPWKSDAPSLAPASLPLQREWGEGAGRTNTCNEDPLLPKRTKLLDGRIAVDRVCRGAVGGVPQAA